MFITIIKGDFMTGVDQEKLKDLILKNKVYLENVNDCSKKMNTLLFEMSNDYIGKSLDDVYFSIMTSIDSLKNIDNILNSYVTCLDSVRKNYIFQDMNFSQQISHKN